MINKTIKVIFAISLLISSMVMAQNEDIDIGVDDEKLGENIPLDIDFYTSEGDTVNLEELFTAPVLLALVYYECPGICSPMLSELAWTVDRIDLEPMNDFRVVTLSFDHRETPQIASNWKKNYFNIINREFPQEAWKFLTGDSVNIRKLTDAVGFHFKPQDKDYLHPGVIITLTPEGKISRYIYGSEYNPFDLKMALIDAEAGKSNPAISKVLNYCFSYDPEGRTYSLNITRVVGTVMLLGVAVFLGLLTIRKKKNKNTDRSI